MSLFLLNLLLALAWSALAGRLDLLNLVFGFVVGYGVLWLVTRPWAPQPYFRNLPRMLEFLLFLVAEMFRANLRMARTILSPRIEEQLRPGVVAVPLDLRSEAGVIFLANMITLTPGTLSLDISTDRRTIFIHTLWLEDAERFRQEIKHGYERRVKEIVEQ